MLDSDIGYRKMFLVAAAYNLVLGFAFLVFFSRLMTLLGMPVPLRESNVFTQMAILLAMAYGVGYYMVSRDLYGQKGIVLLGIIGKSIVFILFVYHFVLSDLHLAIFLIGVGDLVFVLLFWKFLLFARGRTGSDSP